MSILAILALAAGVLLPTATTAKIHEFDKSLLVEKKVLAMLAEFWGEHGFRQVTDDVAFQAVDVDYDYTPAARPAGSTLPATVWVEMKADSTDYQNIFLELVSNGTYNVDTPGCFMFSQAYAWAYVFDTSKEMFVFELGAVRDWVFENFIALKPYLKTTTNKKADGKYAPTMGLAIPVDEFLKALVGKVAFTYCKLPGFGKPVNGVVPRSRLPAGYAHLDGGLDGVRKLLDAAPLQSAPTPVQQFRAHTSRLRHKIIPLKMLAMKQTHNLYASVQEKALGPHYVPAETAVAA